MKLALIKIIRGTESVFPCRCVNIKLSFNQQFKTYNMLVYIACFRKKGDSLYSAPQANEGNLVLRLPIIIREMDTPLTQLQK